MSLASPKESLRSANALHASSKAPKQTEALVALAQAARVHAQAVTQYDRLGAELDALEASLRRDGTHFAFGTPP